MEVFSYTDGLRVSLSVAAQMAGSVVEMDTPKVAYKTEDFAKLCRSKFIAPERRGTLGSLAQQADRAPRRHAPGRAALCSPCLRLQTVGGFPHQYFRQRLSQGGSGSRSSRRRSVQKNPKSHILKMVGDFLPALDSEDVRQSIHTIGKCPLRTSFPNCSDFSRQRPLHRDEATAVRKERERISRS